jgi:hypothetical protein
MPSPYPVRATRALQQAVDRWAAVKSCGHLLLNIVLPVKR